MVERCVFFTKTCCSCNGSLPDGRCWAFTCYDSNLL